VPTREYYDKYWSPGGNYPGGTPSRQLRRALEKAVSPESRVLDFGCGDGHSIGRWLGDRAKSYFGTDVSIVAVESCRELGLEAAVIDDEASVPLNDASIDVAVAIEVIEHLLDPMACVAELRRVVAPGGTLIVTTPNVAYWRRRLGIGLAGRWNPAGDALSVEQPWRDPHLRFFTRGTLQRMLELAGFVDVSVRGHDGALLADMPLIHRWARRRGSAPYRLMERILPSIFGGRLLGVARRADRRADRDS
jgi:SAM-dependent methyltransferase